LICSIGCPFFINKTPGIRLNSLDSGEAIYWGKLLSAHPRKIVSTVGQKKS